MSAILTKLEARFGRNCVVDVFANTGMALKAQELNIGCYVVRGVLPPEQLEGWHQQLEDSLTAIGLQFGTRAVDLRGRSGPAAYRTIQCTSGKCTCKYDYAATGRHTLWKTKDVKPFSAVSDWLHDELEVERWLHFDEIVANIYDRGLNQCAGFHTDQNPLLGETSNILSVSMGAPGVFYWRPNPDGKLRGPGKKEQRRHEAEQTAGLWGCTPLLPGDLLLCRGTFQHHLVHGSLDYREAANVEEVVRKYSLCSEALTVLNSGAYRRYFVDSSLPQPDRSVITFRKIENHYEGCPEIVSGNSGARLREAGRAAWPVGTVIASYEALSRRRAEASRARPVQEPPESQGDHGVWARPEGQTREERATRGDRQHDVIPPWRASTGEEQAPAPAVFGEGLGEVPKSEDSSSSSEDTPPQLEGPQPPAHPPPAEMLPGDPDAFRRAPPQPQQDDAVSPSEVRHRVFEDQVLEAGIFMRSCCEMLEKLEDRIIEVSQPDTRARIQETLAELAAKIKEGARVQNIAECRLEVAASLYLIFKMIIPVM